MNIVKILVPIDFSYHASGAIRQAIYLANRWKAAITLLHIDPMRGLTAMGVEPVYIAPQMFAGLHAEHEAKVDANMSELRTQFAGSLDEGVTMKTEVRLGDAVPGILEFAADWNPDLIVMGSQGVSGVSQLLLGSTADKISRSAPCPVLIAGRDDEAGDHKRTFSRVMAAIDHSEFSEPVARAAAAVSEASGQLDMVHVWNPPYFSALNASLGGERNDMTSILETARSAEANRISTFAHSLKVEHANVTHAICVGAPAAALLEYAENNQVDLLVLGAHSRSSLTERILGTVADRVLRYARVPVLLCPRTALPSTDTDE